MVKGRKGMEKVERVEGRRKGRMRGMEGRKGGMEGRKGGMEGRKGGMEGREGQP